MKGKVRRKPKKLLVMNARNRVTSKMSVPNSNSRTREQRIERRPSKLLGMTPSNRRRKRNKKKWPTFTSWLLKTKIRYHQAVTHLVMIIVNMMMIMMMMMMIMKALLQVNLCINIIAYFLEKHFFEEEVNNKILKILPKKD